MCELISQNRSKIMGLCMCIIMMFHHGMIPGMRFGFLGVDVFLFVSGFGLYHALKKCNEKGLSLLSFYKRRLIRIMPAAIIAGIILRWQFRGFDSVGDYLSVCGLGLWYIRTLLILYLLSPLFYTLNAKLRLKNLLFVFLLCTAGVIVCTYTVFDSIFTLGSMTVTWTLARTPAFLLGMLLPYMEENGCKLLRPGKWHTTYSIFFCCVAAGLLIIFTYIQLPPLWNAFSLYFGWLAFSICLPWLCTQMARGIQYLPEKVQVFLQWVGVRSLELYVCHEAIYGLTRKWLPAAGKISLLVQGACMIIFSVVAAALLHIVCRRLTDGKKKVKAGA